MAGGLGKFALFATATAFATFSVEPPSKAPAQALQVDQPTALSPLPVKTVFVEWSPGIPLRSQSRRLKFVDGTSSDAKSVAASSTYDLAPSPPQRFAPAGIRPDSQDGSLKAIGFAPSPTFSGWSVVPPATLPFQRAIVSPDTVLGTRLTPPGVFADWAPSQPKPQPFARGTIGDSGVVGTALLTAPFSVWSSEIARAQIAASRASNDSFSLAALVVPPGEFAQWSVETARGSWVAKASVADTVLGTRIVTVGTFADWAPPLSNPKSAAVRADASQVVGQLLTAGAFVEWSVSPANISRLAAIRFSDPLILPTTQPPPGEFGDWASSQARALPVAAPRVDSVQPVGALLEILDFDFNGWSVESRIAVIVPPGRLSSDGPLTATVPPPSVWVQWSAEPGPRGVWPVRQPAPETFVGSRLAAPVTAFVEWSPLAIRGSWAARAPGADTAQAVGSLLEFDESIGFNGWSSEPPAVSRLSAVRPADPLVLPITQPPPGEFAQWSVDTAPRGSWIARQPISETGLGTIFAVPPTPFVDWSESVAPARQLSARTSGQGTLAQALFTSVWASWVSEATRGSAGSSRQPVNDFFLGTTQPPPGEFAEWAPVAPRVAAGASRAQDQPFLGQSILASPWAAWSTEPPRGPAALRQPAADFALPALVIPPTEFAVWSVEPPRVWLQPLSRPANQPITSGVTLPPFVAFQQWSSDAVRGTAVKSRPPGEPVLAGSALPLPVLTGVPWSAAGPLPAPVVAPRIVDSFVGAPLRSLFADFAPSVGVPDTGLQRPLLEAFIGAALRSGFADWSTAGLARPAQATASRAVLSDGFLGTAIPTLSPFQQWAPDAPRTTALPARALQPSQAELRSLVLAAFTSWSVEQQPTKPARAQSQDVGFTLSPVISLTPFLAWSVDVQPRALRASAPDQATALAPLGVAARFVQWTAEPARSALRAPFGDVQAWALSPIVVVSKWQDFAASDTRTAYRAPRRDPQPTWSPSIVIPPVTTTFQQWSSEPLRHWSQPAYRPDNQSFRATLVPIAVADICHVSAIFDDSTGFTSPIFDDC